MQHSVERMAHAVTMAQAARTPFVGRLSADFSSATPLSLSWALGSGSKIWELPVVMSRNLILLLVLFMFDVWLPTVESVWAARMSEEKAADLEA